MTHSLKQAFAAAAIVLAGAVGTVMSLSGPARSDEMRPTDACYALAHNEWPAFAAEANIRRFGGPLIEHYQGQLLAQLEGDVDMPVATSMSILHSNHADDDLTLVLFGFADPSQCFFLILNDRTLADKFPELARNTEA